jgi:hypothetical protein
MSRRKRLVALGLLIFLVAIAFAMWHIFSAVQFPGFDRLQIGMTRAEVEAQMGRTADAQEVLPPDLRIALIWKDDNSRAVAIFSRDWKLIQRLTITNIESRSEVWFARFRVYSLGW